ncbi:MAG: Beta-monoglucosyldiacylglycerol synthase [Candidatus Heimdallarchaeota archaeon LC_3]|nr:MAG: Beta-monoglucosyldiacylglycerol synthase [Candidatus Heimdallarchaeota archaeon LC_3]
MLISDVLLFLILSIFLLSIIINIPNGFYLIYISLKGKEAIKTRAHINLKKMELTSEFPSLSLLLPVLNEESQIIDLLDNMYSLEYPGELEILLLDDGSTDNTLKMSKPYEKEFRERKTTEFRIIERSNSQESKGKFENLNRGLLVSKGHIIGIIDADARLEKDSLIKVTEAFVSSNENVVGIQIPWNHRNKGDSWLTKTFVTGIEIHQRIMQQGRSMIDVMIPTYGSGEFWLSSTLKSVKGWNNVITEDIELSYRIQLQNKKVRLSFDTYSDQLAPNSLPGFVQQQSRWASGFFQTFKRLGPSILTGNISRKSKLDSLLLMQFYGLPAITYINFLCFSFLLLISTSEFQPLFWPEITIIIGISISLLLSGLLSSIILQAFIFKQYLNGSFTSTLFWSTWLSLTGLALAPFFFKAMIDGLSPRKLKFKVTPKKNIAKTGFKRLFPSSYKLTFVFLFHIIFISFLLFHAYSILELSLFLSILSYLLILLTINIIFGILSF